MTEPINPGAARSRGDIMWRLDELERRVASLATARRLESASIGRGGLRIQGGQLRIQDIGGDDMFRAGGSPGELFLRQDLLTPLALAVFADRIRSGIVEDQEQLDSTSYTDLPTPGPSVSSVEVISGSMLVTVGARAQNNNSALFMSFEVSGPTSIDPSDSRAFGFSTLTSGDVLQLEADRTVHIPDLDPGTYSVTAKYRTILAGINLPLFADRTLSVIAF